MLVPNIGMPGEGTTPVPAIDISREVRRVFSRFDEMVLRRNWEAAVMASDITPFNDPALQSREVLLRFVAHMWQSGMLRRIKRAR